MSYFDRLIHFYQTLVEDAYQLEEEFDLKRAKQLRRSIDARQRQIGKFIHDYNTSLELTDFSNNEETKQTIEAQLDLLLQIESFNTIVLKINVKTPTGYYMFIKDIIAYGHMLP